MQATKQLYLLCLVLFLSGPAFGFQLINNGPPLAKNGIIDLRKQDMLTKVSLNGEWDFYWQQFIDPKTAPTRKGELVDFPFKWNGYMLKGKELPAFGYATYQLTVLLPKNAGPLCLSMPDVYSAYRLFINGDEVASNGKISTDYKNFEAHWHYNAVDLV